MEFNKEEKEFLKELSDSSLPKIKQSEMFMSIAPPNFMDSPECIFQIGAAMLLDKPIGVLVTKGRTVPKLLQKIAKVVFYCEGEMPTEQETTEFMKKLQG